MMEEGWVEGGAKEGVMTVDDCTMAGFMMSQQCRRGVMSEDVEGFECG
jgi:hypothetical protein